MVDAATKKALSGIPLMKTKAGPRDKEVPSLNWRPSNMSRCGQPDWKRNIWDWSSKIRWYGYAITLRSGQLIQEQWYLYKTRYITNNKEADNDWFRLESNKEGTRWFGKCWHYHNQAKNKPYILKASPTTPTGPQEKLSFPQICPKMPRNGPKMAKKTQNVPKCPKYDPIWPQNGQRMTQYDPKMT